jgi:DNA invertase Pin-like site-specific DNA recombinase
MVRLLAMVDAGAVDTVIIAKLDRLTRSVADLAVLLKRLERRAVSLVSVADALDTRSAAGRLVMNVMMSVSQWEREAVGERTRDAMAHKRAKGQRVGQVPYGYRVQGSRLEPAAAEQATLALIRRLRSEGVTMRGIAAALNAEGVTTRRGTPWRHQYVASSLRA